MEYRTLNPATEEKLDSFDLLNDEQLDTKAQQAGDAFQKWKEVPHSKRKELMLKLAELLEQDKETHAANITREMGKPIIQANAEIQKCALVCRYYAGKAGEFLSPQPGEGVKTESYVAFEPLGVVYAVMPWNFPYWQVFRYACPVLMAGNTTLLKHAPNVPQCSLNIEEIFRKAGFPENVFQSIFIDYEQSNRLIQDPVIKGVTLTGSDRAGKVVAGESGKALKKTVLELGGSDPFIVLDDADIDRAVELGVKARMQNSGQSCIAAKRFILHKNISGEYLDKFVKKIEELKVGDPEDTDNFIGPLARKDLLENLEGQVRESAGKGAEIVTGGERLSGKGYYYKPTVLTGIEPGMPAYDEELFGPVASVFVIDSGEKAIELANDTPYGLGAALWTGDVKKAKELAKDIETGTVAINGMVKSDPHLPFGGIKNSGYGRELSGFGIREFMNIKTIIIF